MMDAPFNPQISLNQTILQEDRQQLADLVAALFKKWALSPEERQNVLSNFLEKNDSEFTLSSDDQLRARYLLTMHACLRLLFPHNPDMRYQWIKRRNRFFDGRTPLAVIIEEGIAGMNAVVRYLESACLQ